MHEVRCGMYAVGFFDLLGQSNALREHISIREDAQHLASLREALTKAARQLHYFRQDITQYFYAAKSESLLANAPAGISDHLRRVAADYDSPQIKVQSFSDTVIAFVPLATPAGKVSLSGVTQLLLSVASTMLMSFSRGVAVRGAIDVGWGMEPFEGEIYGPALLSAYELECKKADWSRIVLGTGIQSLWQVMQLCPINDPIDLCNATFAAMLQNLSFQDCDGVLAIDYLGKDTVEALGVSPGELKQLIVAAHIQLDRLTQSFSGTTKIQAKYKGALDYFESRRGLLTDQDRLEADRNHC
jgi:hypothetical protein